MTKIVFINEEPESEMCLGTTRPTPSVIVRPMPGGDAGAAEVPDALELPLFDAPPSPPGALCECAYWNGAAWERSPPDKTAIACITAQEEVSKEVCAPSGSPSSMSVKKCGTTPSTCEPELRTDVRPDNAIAGYDECYKQAADTCRAAPYVGKALEATACELCKFTNRRYPPDPAPDTEYYEWSEYCFMTESTSVEQPVIQPCAPQHEIVQERRDPRDGWSVTNLCHTCTPGGSPLECGHATCQVIRISAAEGCDEGVQYLGTCIPTGTPLTNRWYLPVPPPPEFTPKPWRPDAVPHDAGVDAGAPSTWDAGPAPAGDAGI